MRMNRKKKLIGAIGLTGVMLALCAGCGKQETGNTAKITLAKDVLTVSGELTLEEVYTTNSTSSGGFRGHGGPKNWNGTEDGTAQDGERPEMPNGEEPSGERPEMPNGENKSGDESEASENQSTNNDIEV